MAREKANPLTTLSRRERQIMEVLYERGHATVAEVHAALPNRPSRTAVRSALWLLEEKGHVRHEQKDAVNVYSPTTSQESARRSALHGLLSTFFGGSRAGVVSAVLGDPGTELTPEEVDRIESLLARYRARKR